MTAGGRGLRNLGCSLAGAGAKARFSGVSFTRLKPGASTNFSTLKSGAFTREQFLLRIHSLGLVGPAPAEQVYFVFGGHGAEAQHAHGEEDQEENYGNHEDWHTSPLRPF